MAGHVFCYVFFFLKAMSADVYKSLYIYIYVDVVSRIYTWAKYEPLAA